MTTENVPPLRIREADGSPNVIPVYEISISGGTVSRIGPTAVQILLDSGGGSSSTVYAQTENTYVVIGANTNLTAERTLAVGRGLALADSGANGAVTLYIPTPLSVSSGGTGVGTITSNNLVYGAGTQALVSMATMHSGALVIGSGNNLPPHILGVGSQGQMLISDSSKLGALAWVNTQAAGAGGTQTIRIPMALMTINPRNANAFYTVKTGAVMDNAFMAFSDLTTGFATYWCNVPNNINSTENWNIFFLHEPNAGAGGDVSLSFRAHLIAHNTAHDTTPVTILSNTTYTTFGAGTLSINSASATVLDSTLGLIANNILRLVVERSGALAADTVGDQWNLWGVYIQADVNS